MCNIHPFFLSTLEAQILAGLIEDTMHTDDYETAYPAEQKEVLKHVLELLKDIRC